MYIQLAAQEVAPASLAAPWLQQGVTGTVVVALVIVVIMLWRREASRQAKDLATIDGLRTELKTCIDGRHADQVAHQKSISELMAAQQKLHHDQHVAHQAALAAQQKLHHDQHVAHQAALAELQAKRFADQQAYSEVVKSMQISMLDTLREVNASVDGSVDFHRNLTSLLESLTRRFDRIDIRLDEVAARSPKMTTK